MGKYDWKYANVGGASRVLIGTGEDIAHLAELDRKQWTVLSCPVKGLEFDSRTLQLLDSDGDGHIHVDEVIAVSQWLSAALKDPGILLKGEGTLALDALSDSEEGEKLRKSALQILGNLGAEDLSTISVEQTSDLAKIFAGSRFNGDGVITPTSAEDEDLKALIGKIAEISGGADDRSGEKGVNAEQIETFYTACSDYAAWKAAAGKDTLPYGESTAAAMDACNALADKIADFFMRCKLIAFDSEAAPAVDVDIEKIKAIGGEDLSGSSEKIAAHPLARPTAEGMLPLDGSINPAWQGAFASLKELVFDKDFKDRKAISEADWNTVLGKFGAYKEWLGAKKGAEVEALGLDEIKAILKADRKAALMELVESDKALESEALGIEAVDKLLHYCRDFYSFLCNYVVFSDFYDSDKKAVFQAGKLYVDQRCCELCVSVDDMGRHADMPAHSGMFLIYCDCKSKLDGSKRTIVAAVTKGSIDGLIPGKNGVFYDRDGLDYDATITKVVDNPISVLQAFWSPYRKFGKWISERFGKKAADKEAAGFDTMTAKAAEAPVPGAAAAPAAPKSSFDIAKFAGIFAAIGMAIAYLSQALVALARGASNAGWLKVLLVIAAIMLVISLPSMILAWIKLRKRDVGPVLNANGWAINARSYVRPRFGKTLTSVAKYPRVKKSGRGAVILIVVLLLILALLAVYYFFL
ncbi:MAG: hypothetical protein K6C31_04615 [Bacteroidales bacterium]|nr:hypothetical protein [Bacteroidales bacterium]